MREDGVVTIRRSDVDKIRKKNVLLSKEIAKLENKLSKYEDEHNRLKTKLKKINESRGFRFLKMLYKLRDCILKK